MNNEKMISKFCLQSVLFFGFTIQCTFVEQYESQRLIHRFFTDIKKVTKFFFDSSDAKSQSDDSIISSGKVQTNNNVSSPYCDDTLLTKMKKEFIRRVHWDEQGLLDHHFNKEYRKKYDFYTKKIFEFQKDIAFKGDVLEQILSIKFDAIMKTLFSMIKNPEQIHDYGIFKEFFDIVQENNFIIDRKNFEPLLDKIIEVMQSEQRRVYYEKRKQEGFLLDLLNFFMKKEDKEDEAKEDRFAKIFVKYGLDQENSLLWDMLFDERRYDFHIRRIEDAGRWAAYSME